MSEQESVSQPTAEDETKAMQVGAAGAQAAAAAPAGEEEAAFKTAAKGKADEVGLDLSDEDINKLSEQLFGRLAGLFEQRGAFQPPPEPVQPPPTAPAAPGEMGAGEPPTEIQVPRKKTWAERYFGQ